MTKIKREPFPLKHEKGDAVIKNIGLIVTGDINKPTLNKSKILVKEGLIKKIGDERTIKDSEAETV
ncbi:MAG: hypothetical protein QW495_06790, partial [Candidatus Hadarchaeum sp.]